MLEDIYPEWMFKAFKNAKKTPKVLTVKELDECDKILYGTFGPHADETPEQIVERKLIELKCGFSLWSGEIGKIESEITKIGKPVYVLLKFTDSKPQEGSGEFKWFFFENEWRKLSDYNIKVRDKREKGKAFVVEDYLLFEKKISFAEIRECYHKPNGEKLCTRTPFTLVEKNDDGLRADAMPRRGDSFAIILKLKEPYVVDLKR